jgi:hypothetical protein
MLASLVQLTIDVGLSSQVTVSEHNDDMTPRGMRLLVGIQQTTHFYIVRGVPGCLKLAEPGVRRTRVVMSISPGLAASDWTPFQMRVCVVHIEGSMCRLADDSFATMNHWMIL